MMKTKSTPLLWLLLLAICLSLFTPTFAQQAYPPSVTITYRDLDGNILTLRAFSGRKIRYALPDNWLDGSAQTLTPSELVTLIDRTDSLYEKMAEVINGEPRGDGLMTIAIVPLASSEGGVSGTALIGVKTCEIASTQLAATKMALAQGTLPDVILHEVAHTFDVYRNYLSYYLDSSHSWTEFWIPYAQYLLRMGDYRMVPEITLQEKIYRFTSRWDARASAASWEQCVKTGSSCDGVTANRAYAGLLLRYARLHGADAFKRVFQYFKDYKTSHDPNEIFTFTPEEKNDLLVEALAYGVNANVSGELDAWFWPLSQATRAKLGQLYPAANPYTQDADNDGWTPLQGDTADHDPTIHPGAAEVIDGKDNDCNGFIDDVRRTASPTILTPPARLTGHLRPGQSESYRFEASGTLLIRPRVTGGSFVGQVSIIPEGQATATNLFGIEPFQSNYREFSLMHLGPWTLRVDWVSGNEGDYEVVLAFPPISAGATGEVLSLPLRAPTSARARSIVPGGLARAVVTLPGISAPEANAQVDSQGHWPLMLSGFEVFVNGIPAILLTIKRSESTYSLDFVVSPQAMVTLDARASIVVRHSPSGAQWSSASAELRDSAPAIWSQASDGQTPALALALESPTFLTFSEARGVPPDGTTRVMLFANNLGSNRGTGVTRLIAELQDGRRVTIPVEYVGPTSLPGIDQIIFKVDAALSGQSQVLLTIEGGEDVWVSLSLK